MYIESIFLCYERSIHLILYHGQRHVQQSERSPDFPIPATQILARSNTSKHRIAFTFCKFLQFCKVMNDRIQVYFILIATGNVLF